jgi:histone deacetylase 11
MCREFRDDGDMFNFDMYIPAFYPSYDEEARERIDCDLPLPAGCRGGEYLEILQDRLPRFLDSILRSGDQPLRIYNAGSDVVRRDRLRNSTRGEPQMLASLELRSAKSLPSESI